MQSVASAAAALPLACQPAGHPLHTTTTMFCLPAAHSETSSALAIGSRHGCTRRSFNSRLIRAGGEPRARESVRCDFVDVTQVRVDALTTSEKVGRVRTCKLGPGQLQD